MAADYGLVFYKEGYSNLGRSPTKLGEYWACGIPAVLQDGVGDLNFLADSFPRHAALFTYNDRLEELPVAAWKRLKKSTTEDRRKAAKSYFSLDNGIEFYHNIYQDISKQ